VGRPSWDQYFLNIAEAVSERSDCERSRVGAVVVKDRRIRGTGYNGAPAGKPGCESCPRRTAQVVPGESDYDSGPTLCNAVHAEANALLYCDREDLIGSTLYITREPCYGCQKLIDAAGVEKVVTPDRLREELAVKEFIYVPRRVLFGSGPVYKYGYTTQIADHDIKFSVLVNNGMSDTFRREYDKFWNDTEDDKDEENDGSGCGCGVCSCLSPVGPR